MDWPYFIMKNGTSNIFTLKFVFERNSVDQPIYPRRGSDFSVSLTLTPPYSLLDGKDYKNPDMPDAERFQWIEYHKWLFSGKWFKSISNNNKLVLMARAELGFLGYYDKYKPSPFEGFDVGGDGMSGYNIYGVDVIGLRGYENSSLTPNRSAGQYANMYSRYTLEMRYPFILQPSSTIYGLAFAEAGNGYADWQSFDPFLLKRSLGVGARIFLPMIGMIGVDWGWGFDMQVGDTKRHGGQFHFSMGQQF